MKIGYNLSHILSPQKKYFKKKYTRDSIEKDIKLFKQHKEGR
jgi:hypothetical protein